MTGNLKVEDWERIVFALSLFRHNEKFKLTLDKVNLILENHGKE